MERGEITKRIASIMLRVSAAAIASYGAYQLILMTRSCLQNDFVGISVPKSWCVEQIKDFDKKCSTIPMTKDCLDLKNGQLLTSCRFQVKNSFFSPMLQIIFTGLIITPITIIAARIPLKLNSMIAEKPAKPVCK